MDATVTPGPWSERRRALSSDDASLTSLRGSADPEGTCECHPVLAAALEQSRSDRTEVEQLRAALVSRSTIDQAKGILMSRFGLSPDQAFDVLSAWSQHTNIKVRVLASRLIERATVEPELPGVAPFMDAFLSARPGRGS